MIYQKGVEEVSKANREYCLKWAKKIKAISYLGNKCKKCGNENIFQLCFHHRDGKNKDANIATFLLGRWSKITKELNKCDLLCFNCHHELHNKDGNIFKRQILEENQKLCCGECGYTNDNLSSLSFHHRNPLLKKYHVGRMFRSWRRNYSIKVILEEINKCDILCINCHRIHTVDVERFEKNRKLIYDLVNDYDEPENNIDENYVVKLAREGLTNKEISEKLNRYSSTISRTLKKYGLIKKNINKGEIFRLKEKGFNGMEISK
jgi:hypothetical protein